MAEYFKDIPKIKYEGAGAKVRVREEKNPDHQLRSPNNS